MKVILLKDVESLGSAGEVVQVKDGYGRNFLIPRNEALVATDTNVAQFESRRKQHEAVADRERRAAGRRTSANALWLDRNHAPPPPPRSWPRSSRPTR